ncbi:Sulfate permease, partial [hydrothermal vent metagenome]
VIGLKSKVLILRMRHVSFIDDTGLHNLIETIKILKAENITIILSGVNYEIKTDFKKSEINNLIPNELICDNFAKALDLAERLLKAQMPSKNYI